MVYPTSNLPTASQPWGREMQKQLVNAQTTIAANDINNSARDVQLQANFNRVNSAALKAQAAIDEITGVTTNIYVDGTTNIDGGVIQTGTVDAAKLKATDSITLTNATGSEYVQFGHQDWGSGVSEPGITGGNTTQGDTYFVGPWTGTGGAWGSSQRGVSMGSIYSGSAGPSLQLYTQTSPSFSQNAKLTDGSDSVQIGGGYVRLLSGEVNIGSGSATMSASAATSTSSMYAPLISITGTSGISISGTITSALSVSSTINYAGGITSGNIKYTGYASALGTGTALYLGGSGTQYTIGILPSSRRFKENIQPIEDVSYVDRISLLTPVTFNYKENPAQPSFGLIAEDVDAAGLTDIVHKDLDDDGNSVPFSLMYDRLAVYMIPAIKELNERIKTLEGK